MAKHLLKPTSKSQEETRGERNIQRENRGLLTENNTAPLTRTKPAKQRRPKQQGSLPTASLKAAEKQKQNSYSRPNN
jgi:hypothetical protein